MVADVLIANGADLTAKDRTGATLLHTASQLGLLSVVNKLIEKGAEINAKTNPTQAPSGRGGGGFRRGPSGEQTALMLAARGNHLEVMRSLVKAGADPKLKAQDGSTLVMAAAASGHVEVVQYAYELNPDVKSVTNTKSTAMHAAISSLQVASPPEMCKVIQFLADKGADLDALDANGRTPVSIADLIPIDAVVDLLGKLITASGAEPHIKSKR